MHINCLYWNKTIFTIVSAAYEEQVVAFFRQPDITSIISNRYRRGVRPQLRDIIGGIRMEGTTALERIQMSGSIATYELAIVLRWDHYYKVLCVTLKMWEWPWDEAMYVKVGPQGFCGIVKNYPICNPREKCGFLIFINPQSNLIGIIIYIVSLLTQVTYICTCTSSYYYSTSVNQQV